MKKLPPLLLLPFFYLSGCGQTESVKNDRKTTEVPVAVIEDSSVISERPESDPKLPDLTIVPNGEVNETYKEIETGLTVSSFDGMYYLKAINQEIERLQKKGDVFWHDSSQIHVGRKVMHQLHTQIECFDSEKSKCAIVKLTSIPEFLPSNFKVSNCFYDGQTLEEGQSIQESDQPCEIVEPEFPKEFANSLTNVTEIYAGFDGYYYIVGLKKDNDQYGIYQNDKEIFSSKMHFSPIGVTEEAAVVLDSPAFTFNSDEEVINGNQVVHATDIFYKGETLNKKYDLDSSSHLFAYQDKLGFVAEKDGKTFIFFNGEKVSSDFDKIITRACCMSFAYPIQVDENGVLFFMAGRGEKTYFVEMNLNEYL